MTASPAADPEGPLAGVRVVDLGFSWAGPFAGMILADLGAQVIKIESRRRLDLLRWSGAFADGLRDYERSGFFTACNRGKQSVTLNLKHPAGGALLLKLVAQSSVFLENFSPRVLTSLGLTDDVLFGANPALVVMSMSAYGNGGPDQDRLAYGDHLLHASGLASLTGHPEDAPTRINTYYGDPVAGLYGALGILAALDRVQAGGPGEHLHLSQVQGLLSSIPTQLMDASRGNPGQRQADKSASSVPHGFYRCQGDDAWVALAVETDAQWHRFAELIGWEDAAGTATLGQRRATEASIDRHVEAWTGAGAQWDVASACQRVGVPCHPVQSALGLLLDDHLAARSFFQWVNRPVTGPGPIPGVTFRIAGGGIAVRGPAPVLGQHNDDILCGLLGLDRPAVDALIADGAVA